MSLSTHVLNLSTGQPASGMHVTLLRGPEPIGDAVTDSDGRVTDLLSGDALEAGMYQLNFDVAAYFAEQSIETFYETIPILFNVQDIARHYHVPLLLSPFGYSTYRGS